MRPSLFVAAMLSLAPVAHAQSRAATWRPTMDEFIDEVSRSNPELAAQRADVTISLARVTVARVFPDPSVTVGVTSLDVSGVGAQNSVGAALSMPLEWPGRLGARVAVAQAERAQAVAGFEDALRTLRATAALAFIDALAAREEALARRESLAALTRFVGANEVRLNAGDIGQVQVLQARVEAERYRAEVLTAEGETAATGAALAMMLGASQERPRFVEPRGELRVAPVALDEDALVARAVRGRTDVLVRRAALSAARARSQQAAINRGVDATVGVGWQYYTPGAQGSAFQAPPYHTLTATLTVPLPFSRINRGDLAVASAGEIQAQSLVIAAELRATSEVLQASARYRAALAALAVYDGGLLANAQRVFDAMSYAYQRGSATLLEVLSAQRTLDDVRHGLVGALASVARSRVALELAVGSRL